MALKTKKREERGIKVIFVTNFMTTPPNQNSHWLPEILRSRWVKIPFIIIVFCIATFAIYLCVRALSGYPVTILGNQVNQPIPKTDTVIKIKEVVVPVDTSSVKKELPKQDSKRSYQLKKPGSPKDTTSKTTVNAKNYNSGTNSGHIGDNYYEPQLTDDAKIYLTTEIDKIKNVTKTSPTCFNIILSTLTNGANVGSQIKDFLESKGYRCSGTATMSNLKSGIHVGFGNFDKNCLDIFIGSL